MNVNVCIHIVYVVCIRERERERERERDACKDENLFSGLRASANVCIGYRV